MTEDRLGSSPLRDAQRFRKLPRGRQGLARAEVEASQRGRLMDAMVLVVSERGYGATGVADVISVAGVSRRDFYRLYIGTEDCFLAAYGTWADRLYVTAAPGLDPAAGDWPSRLRLGLSTFLDFIAAHPAVARTCLVEALAAGPRVLERRAVAMRPLVELVGQGRLEAPHPVPSITARALVDGIHEVARNEIIHEATSSLPRHLPDLTFLVVQRYLGARRAARERRRAVATPPATAIR